MKQIVYCCPVAPVADTPIAPGLYHIRLVEGGTYRNLKDRRKYSICELDPISGTVRYEFIQGKGERVEDEHLAPGLGVVKAVGDTPTALVDPEEVGLL